MAATLTVQPAALPQLTVVAVSTLLKPAESDNPPALPELMKVRTMVCLTDAAAD
jgi:hypothetical protein